LELYRIASHRQPPQISHLPRFESHQPRLSKVRNQDSF
jgi:hypothetical protein